MKKRTFVYLFTVEIFMFVACNKQDIREQQINLNANPTSENIISPACSDFYYPDTIFYPSDYPADYEIRTVKRLAGTFGAYPDGLNIDEDNGDIEIKESETGLKYLVWYVPRGTRDTCKLFVTVSGVNYPDSIFSIKNNSGMATPIYNGSATQSAFCTGNCEFDDGHDDDNGNGFGDEPPLGQEIIPQGVAMDKATGAINLRQTIMNGALGSAPASGTFKDYILNYRLSDHSAKALNRMTLRIYYYRNQSQIPASFKKDLAEKQRFTLLNKATDPYSVAYTVKISGGDLTAREREVKCRPPYIIVVQK